MVMASSNMLRNRPRSRSVSSVEYTTVQYVQYSTVPYSAVPYSMHLYQVSYGYSIIYSTVGENKSDKLLM